MQIKLEPTAASREIDNLLIIAFDGFHEGALILREALCLFVVPGCRATFRVFFDLAPVPFIRVKIGKTE